MRNRLLFIFFISLSTLSAFAKPIGNLQTLTDWQGLSAAQTTTPQGEAVAQWNLATPARFTYTKPSTFLAGHKIDFSEALDVVAVDDWYDYRYLTFQVKLPSDQPLKLTCTVEPLKVGRPDYVDSVSSTLTLQGKGWQTVVFSLRDFDYLRHQGTFWKHIQRVTLSGRVADGKIVDYVLLSQPRLQKGKVLALSSPIQSKPAQVGETIHYELQIENESRQLRHVAVVLTDTAYEACPARLSETEFTLAPGAARTITLSVDINDLLPPGGREARTVTVIPDGRGDLKETLSVISVRALPHPYLLHTDAGWQDVMQKAETVDWARTARQAYIDKANKWRVPEARTQGDYSFRHSDGGNAENCAVAWKLSGDEALAQKVIQFLRNLSDPEKGYPTTIRNSGAHVHRGMFFMHVARAYDLVYNHPSLTEHDHEMMAHTMRLFNEWVDYMLQTGDGNNHQDGLSAGAIMNSLVLQDFDQVNRFLYGTGGMMDLIAQGILDDGQYFEGTANYNILAGNIFNSVAVALDPWGLNMKDWKIPAKYGKHILVSPWALSGEFLGMSFERQGPSTRTYRQLKDIWDAVLPMCDWRGVVFASNDSGGINLAGGQNNEAGFGFDMAYYLWRDPAYVPLLKMIQKRDLLYGVADLPDVPFNLGQASYVNDNAGFAVLRTQAEDPRERYQVVQRYGTHGGYHGHFDKTSLLSLSRFGRSHYNTEASWFGYWSFMFKMWVQTSDAHNMVVVDHRMQKPNDNKRIFFHSGPLMQAVATEIETPWIDPPYGGQTPYALKMPEEKSWQEARWLPTPEHPRPQGCTGTPTEPVLQRRLIIVTDQYVILSDYLKSENSHHFDNLFNCKGLTRLSAAQKTFLKKTPQCDPSPYSSAQFITACEWYQTQAPVKAEFVLDESKGEMGGRHAYSEPGLMNIDYYSLWPKESKLMVGNYAESLNVARHLYYKIIGDGRVLKEGKQAPWILGSTKLDLDVQGIQTLQIETRVEKASHLKTIFLGAPTLQTADGKIEPITLSTVQTENIAPAAAPNQDYAAGKVTLFGQDYAHSIAAEPKDRKKAGTLTIDLRGKKATRFTATLGGDYPVGGDDIHRKIIATRATGTEARFLSAIELHENQPMIQSIHARSANEIIVQRTDGKTDTLHIQGLDGDASKISIHLTTTQDGNIIQEERAE